MIDLEGYKSATGCFAFVNDKQKNAHLIFASIMLNPHDFPDYTVTDPETVTLDKGKAFVGYKNMGLEDAISWFEKAKNNEIKIPGEKFRLNCSQLLPEPTGKKLNCLTECQKIYPFIPKGMKCPRIASLLSSEKPTLWGDKHKFKALQFLKKQLSIDFDKYPEFLGSVHLIAPNPFLKFISVIAKPELGSIVVESELRSGQSYDHLQVFFENHGIGTISDFQTRKLEEKIKFETTDFQSCTLRVVHRGKDLIYWDKPYPFFLAGEVQSSIDLGETTITNEKESYSVKKSTKPDKIQIGKKRVRALTRIIQSAEARDKKEDAKRLGQELMYIEDKARDRVRKLIQDAQDTVFIVDCYFGYLELTSFAIATRGDFVRVKVLTSSMFLKMEKYHNEENVNQGYLLWKTLEKLPDTLKNNIEIRVILGKSAPHDRFLCVDQAVYLSGNSFNNIGDRMSMMVKLPDPDMISPYLDTNWKKSISLNEWISKTTNSRPKN